MLLLRRLLVLGLGLMLMLLMSLVLLCGRGDHSEWRNRLAQPLRALGAELRSAAQCQMVVNEKRRKQRGAV